MQYSYRVVHCAIPAEQLPESGVHQHVAALGGATIGHRPLPDFKEGVVVAVGKTRYGRHYDEPCFVSENGEFPAPAIHVDSLASGR